MSPPRSVRTALEEAASSDDVEALLAAIDRLPEVDEEAERDTLIAEFVYNRHNSWLRAGRFPDCLRLLARYTDLIPVIGQSKGVMLGATSGKTLPIQDALAGDACALWNLSRDDAAWRFVDLLMPARITLPALAYNLACAWALCGDKRKLLPAIALSRSLGSQREQFMSDADFNDFKSDLDFLKALS